MVPAGLFKSTKSMDRYSIVMNDSASQSLRLGKYKDTGDLVLRNIKDIPRGESIYFVIYECVDFDNETWKPIFSEIDLINLGMTILDKDYEYIVMHYNEYGEYPKIIDCYAEGNTDGTPGSYLSIHWDGR